MDDYYELLGVDADAPVDDIRAAYRDKKAAVADDTDTDEAKAEAAALNKAWNVLSDPYQRGRYDEQRADADESDADDDEDDDEVEATPRTRRPGRPGRPTAPSVARTRASPARSRRSRCRPAWRSRRRAGASPPCSSTSCVLLVLFLGSQFLVLPSSRSRSTRRRTHAPRDLADNQIKAAHTATGNANKAKSAADKTLADL